MERTMSDLRVIARELVRAAQAGESVVLASVVRTEGATYRGVGARMIVRADDTMVGLLSGGCLEGDLVQHAARVRESGEAEVVTYDGRSGDDVVWGLGLGCKGLVEILLERRSADSAGAFGAMLSRALDEPSASIVATVVRASGRGAPEIGARVLVRAPIDVARDGEWGRRGAIDAVIADAMGGHVSERRGMNLDYVLADAIGSAVGDAVSAQVAFELVKPTVALVICGSGPDAIPVVKLALSLGWDVTVVDPRPVAVLPPERFAGARVVECAHSERLGDVIAPSARTAALVMSHNYERDLDYFDALTRGDVAYIGVLGPRARTERLLEDLEARGRACLEPVLSRVHAPIGLDVGGDGAEAIALSIIAEVSAVMHGRAGTSLREGLAAIHESPSLV
jgi:xanthine/CO dehydrogenase XdhC/CoxF family maturation factor